MRILHAAVLRLLPASVLCVAPILVRAQYIEPREERVSTDRFLHLGLRNVDFAPRSSNPIGDSLGIRFRCLMPVVGFHQGPVDVAFGYTRYTLGGVSRSAIFFGTTVANDIPLAGKMPSALMLPVMIAIDYSKAGGVGAERDNFNVASVGAGAGLKYRLFSRDIDLTVYGAELGYFSFDALSYGNGVSAATVAGVTLQLKRIGVFDGTAVGYRFRLQNWFMKDNNFNYHTLDHGLFVGVIF